MVVFSLLTAPAQAGVKEAYQCMSQSSALSSHGSPYALFVDRYDSPLTLYTITPSLTLKKVVLPKDSENYLFKMPMLPNHYAYIHSDPQSKYVKDIRLGQTYKTSGKHYQKTIHKLTFEKVDNQQEVSQQLSLIKNSMLGTIHWLKQRWKHNVKKLSSELKTCHKKRSDYAECVEGVHKKNYKLEYALKKYRKQLADFAHAGCDKI